MVDQKLQSLPQTQTGIPEEWQEHFLIKRIQEDSITITLQERDAILKALNEGQKFIQVGKFTLMLNAIKSIDPVYPPDNIPQRPKELEMHPGAIMDRSQNPIMNQKEIDLWDKIFGEKQLHE
jgi:hypothetical protein